VNDSALTRRVAAVLIRELGTTRAVDLAPGMGSEDFSAFQLAGVPTLMLRVGASEPAQYAAAMKAGTQMPSLHSALFTPDREPTIKTAMLVEVLALRELMSPSRAPAK
jgi:metal-dependent amidase/aminoacylase/carboxypeptidase family protein